MFDALAASLERIERKVDGPSTCMQYAEEKLEDSSANMGTNISRLETLVMCLPNPSVDEVLDQMLERNCTFTQLDHHGGFQPRRNKLDH